MRYFLKSRRFKIAAAILALLLLVSVIARIAGGALSPQQSILGSIIAPFQSAFTSVSNFFKDLNRDINGSEELARENAELKNQINELTSSLLDYEAAVSENKFLRDYLDIKDNKTDYQFVDAKLIARDSDDPFGTFTVNKGSLHSVAVYDPVIDSNGLIGYVSEVGASYCKVTTVLSPDISVAAFDRRTGDLGILSGILSAAENGDTRLGNLSRNCSVAIGDYIVTSGGGVFPDGLLIGTVSAVGNDYNSLIYADITPAADLDDLRDMMIITYFSGQTNLGGE
ncbi:MAG: rod shape-determining protein MreC [Clostridia bacterium]|nr:rod shape-determining protein MreC [Clostridia bacterium]MBR3594063.1 rod shape-determining protein MreC [Clostridia bacterium]